MALIFITGNYNFFNILTSILAVSVLYDDGAWKLDFVEMHKWYSFEVMLFLLFSSIVIKWPATSCAHMLLDFLHRVIHFFINFYFRIVDNRCLNGCSNIRHQRWTKANLQATSSDRGYCVRFRLFDGYWFIYCCFWSTPWRFPHTYCHENLVLQRRFCGNADNWIWMWCGTW